MTRIYHVLPALALLLVIPPLCAQQGGAEWPQWRGPNRNGISTEPGLGVEGKGDLVCADHRGQQF